MKLQIFKRITLKKSETNKIRRDGNIPAVMYVKGKAVGNLAVNGVEFDTVLRTVQQGRLSTMIFELKDQDGKTHRAILKEVQYEPTTYKVQHLDFEELLHDTKVNIKVPIELFGAVDCVGVKLGGFLRQVLRHIHVNCLPKDIPPVFQIDVRSMEINQSKRLADLDIPQTVKPLTNLNEVAVIVAKR